jgi:fatty acid desaturase
LILFSPLLRHLMPDDAMPLPYAIDTPLLWLFFHYAAAIIAIISFHWLFTPLLMPLSMISIVTYFIRLHYAID